MLTLASTFSTLIDSKIETKNLLNISNNLRIAFKAPNFPCFANRGFSRVACSFRASGSSHSTALEFEFVHVRFAVNLLWIALFWEGIAFGCPVSHSFQRKHALRKNAENRPAVCVRKDSRESGVCECCCVLVPQFHELDSFSHMLNVFQTQAARLADSDHGRNIRRLRVSFVNRVASLICLTVL